MITETNVPTQRPEFMEMHDAFFRKVQALEEIESGIRLALLRLYPDIPEEKSNPSVLASSPEDANPTNFYASMNLVFQRLYRVSDNLEEDVRRLKRII